MPIVETLESYSRALLPLRALVRRPFQAVADSFRLYGPRVIEMHRQLETVLLGTPFVLLDQSNSPSAPDTAREASTGPATPSSASQASKILLSQPSFLNYFTSSYALLMFFVSLVLNRVNAIVAPRNPHPLKLSLRFALKIPAFYLLIKSAMITGALLATNSSLLPFDWPQALQTKTSTPSALFLSLSAMGVSYITDTFIANLQNTGSGEQNFNMVEMSVMFHFTPHGKDVLLVAFIQVCQLLSLQIASLFPRGRQYRLAITSFWGMMDMAHFVRAVYRRSITYPSMQLFTCMPEAAVILMIAISACVHGLTYLVTGGNIRRRMFEQRALPTGDEEYGIAVFKLGRACLEATRGMGFWNEVDAVVIPFGTVLDKRRIRITTLQSDLETADASSSSSSSSSSTSATDSRASQPSWTASFQSSSSTNPPPMPSLPPTGFSHEMLDEVQVPGQRQHISRRQRRINNMRAFTYSYINFCIDAFFAIYNRIVPAQFQRRRRRIVVRPIATTMSVQEYLQLKNAIEAAMELAGRPASPETQRDEVLLGSGADGDSGLRTRRRWPMQAEDEERIYSRFLTDGFSEDEDEDESDAEFIPPPEVEDEVDSDSDAGWYRWTDVDSQEEVEQEASLSIDEADTVDSGDSDGELAVATASASASNPKSALGSLQEFLLDASFLSIFLSGQGHDKPLTRAQHRRVIDSVKSDADSPSDDEDSIQQRGRQGITSIRNRRSKMPPHPHGTMQRSFSSQQNAELLALLQKHRKTGGSLTAGATLGTPATAATATSVSEASTTSPAPGTISSVPGDSSMSPPPMAEMPSNPEESSFYGRLLCVVCQAEPRNVLLRPCRCLALCNDCRELLAIRRFKQCPCCRSDVDGFSKIYLP